MLSRANPPSEEELAPLRETQMRRKVERTTSFNLVDSGHVPKV